MCRNIDDKERDCKSGGTKMNEFTLSDANTKGITKLEQLTGIPQHVLINQAVQDYASIHKI